MPRYLDKLLPWVAWGLFVAVLVNVTLLGMAQAAHAAPADGQAASYGQLAVQNLWHFVINLFYGLVMIAALFAVLRYRDILLGLKFKSGVIPKIHRSGMATAVYYSAWVLAGAIILSAAFA